MLPGPSRKDGHVLCLEMFMANRWSSQSGINKVLTKVSRPQDQSNVMRVYRGIKQKIQQSSIINQ